MIRLFNKIEYCPARHLAVATPLSTDKVIITHYVPWNELPTRDLISVETADSAESLRSWTTKVIARLRCERQDWHEPMAFRLTHVTGRQFLIGLSFGPFPVWTCRDIYPDNPAERSECQLNVVWKNVMSMMEIL